MEKDKIIAEFEIPVYDTANNRTAFIFTARLENVSYTENGKTHEEQGWFITTNGEYKFNQLLMIETELGKVLNTHEISNNPINKEEAIELVTPLLIEATKNANLTPYFYPKELSDSNGDLIMPLVEKFEELMLDHWFEENTSCFKDECLIPFIKAEHLFKIVEHIKSLPIDDRELTSFEESIIEAEVSIEKIREEAFYKSFPNETVAQKYFDDYYQKDDCFYTYQIIDEDDNVKLSVVTDVDNNWKVFFVIHNI